MSEKGFTMFSKKFYQICLVEIILLIILWQFLFSQQFIFENNGVSISKVGKIYDNIRELNKTKSSNIDEEINGIFIKPDDIVKDVSFLCMGSSSKAFLAEEIGFLVGIKLKKHGLDFCVTGFPLTLSPNQEESILSPKDFVSSSPYITAQIRSGVFPVIDGSKGFEMSVINSMKSKRIYLPILISEEQYEKFQTLNYDVPVMIKKKDGIFCENDTDLRKYLKLYWKIKIRDLDLKIQGLRLEILKSSIVLVKRGKFKKIKIVESKKAIKNLGIDDGVILINDPLLINPKKIGGLVVVFSRDDIIIDEAKKVLRGLSVASGKITWITQ